MRKLSISMANFNSYVSHYQRIRYLRYLNVGIAMISHPPNHHFNGSYKASKIRVVYDIAIPRITHITILIFLHLLQSRCSFRNPQKSVYTYPESYMYPLWLFNIAGWKIHCKWRFLAGKIIYFYGSSIPWLC